MSIDETTSQKVVTIYKGNRKAIGICLSEIKIVQNLNGSCFLWTTHLACIYDGWNMLIFNFWNV